MIDPIYAHLAERLDSIPSGYPPTKSGVELRILEKLFTPEQAALANVMRLRAEPSARIAKRFGMSVEEVERRAGAAMAD